MVHRVLRITADVRLYQRRVLADNCHSCSALGHHVKATADIFTLPRVHILHAVEYIVLGQHIPVLRIRTGRGQSLAGRAGENMVNACHSRHQQGDDVGVLDSFRVIEERIGKFHLDIAASIAIVINLVRQELVVCRRHRKHGRSLVACFIGEIEIVAERVSNGKIHHCVAACVGSAHGSPNPALVGIVERVVVDVIAQYEGTHGELIGKVGSCTSFKVWELFVCIVAGRIGERYDTQGSSVDIFSKFHHSHVQRLMFNV